MSFVSAREGGALSKHPRKGVTQINYGLTDSSKYTDLDELRHLVDREDGDGLQSHIQETFSLAEAARALNVSMGGRVVGKLAICVSCNDSQTSVAQSPSAHAQHGKEYESAAVQTVISCLCNLRSAVSPSFTLRFLKQEWLQLMDAGARIESQGISHGSYGNSSNHGLAIKQQLALLCQNATGVGVVVTSD